MIPNFFKSIFVGESENEEDKKQKKEQKDFEIFKFDGLRAQKMEKYDYAEKCFLKALDIKEEFETMNYLSQLYLQTDKLD
ncbi:MAG: hypothetical protein WCR45_09275 [Bacteroidaceae bacterium]